MKTFHIDGSGISQVKSHVKCRKRGPKQLFWKILKLTPEDQVAKGEIFQALHFAEDNYSFSSAASGSVRFEMMFPDSQL